LLGQTNGCGDARNSGSYNDGFFRHIITTTQNRYWFLGWRI
jgi:hypothetical protein